MQVGFRRQSKNANTKNSTSKENIDACDTIMLDKRPTMYDLSAIFTRRALLGICVFLSCIITYLVTYPNCSSPHVVQRKRTYGIMFDAGSTGSRIHVYQFSVNDQGLMDLEKEIFKQVKPGLSAYAPEPLKGAGSLKAMLQSAKDFIPSTHWEKTPIALKATAGLRLLPEASANNLLNEVKSLFYQYPFSLSSNSIQIMEGTDEGVFSWMTVNFLLKKLIRNERTIGALDLGGGSTQITYVPDSQDTLQKSPEGFTKKISVFGLSYTLYTHSYLGLGLMSARLQIYGGTEDKKVVTSSTSNTLKSACLPANFKGKWAHGNTDYNIVGETQGRSGFEPCYKEVLKLVSGVDKPRDLKHQTVYLFSYYYDRAVESGLINGSTGGTVKLNNFYQAAITECGRPDIRQPHLCTDLTYIYTLLRDGFGFDINTQLVLAKKINGVELGWALGATFQIIKHNSP